MSRTGVLSTTIATEREVFAVRRQGRQLAAALGLESQDQVLVAAALSEVTRQELATLGLVTVHFALDLPEDWPAPRPGTRSAAARAMLRIVAHSAGVADDAFVEAVRVTRGLMDEWDVARDAAGVRVSLGRHLPERATMPSPAEIESIRAAVATPQPDTPLEELAEHNRQLMAALLDMQRQRDELLRLNEELAETNKGVVALYSELSEGLEATNRGDVALHAELDQRTTQLRTASEAKSRFLANISHELRALVTSIAGLARLLRDPSADPSIEDQAHQLGLIDSSAGGLLTLINELLDLAKAESGRLVPQREDVDLRQLFGTRRGILRTAPRSPETELSIVDPQVGPVHTDPLMLSKVLRNLLINAIKFTPPGTVGPGAELKDGGDLSLVLADTGIGIPPEEHERVFEEFHQVRNPLQATAPGTGLGLPCAQRLVPRLGGSIALDRTPGEGSMFTVRLPADIEGETGPRLTRVLVIDDDGGFRTAPAGVLRAGGYAVVDAPDANTGLAAADAHPPDLILLDLRPAEQHGADVLDALATNSRVARRAGHRGHRVPRGPRRAPGRPAYHRGTGQVAYHPGRSVRGGPQHGTARGRPVTATKRTAPIAPTDRTDPGPAPDTVLVLDDTPSKRYLLANWLGRGGFTVVEAPTGTEALRMVRTGGIHIVVLDVRLVALRRTPLSAEGPGPWPS